MLALNRVIVFSSDVEKSASFYQTMFGFTALPSDYPASEWLELETGGCRIAFHKAYEKGGGACAHKLVFFSDNPLAVRDELIAKGANMLEAKQFGDLILCDGVDIDGNRFQISNRD